MSETSELYGPFIEREVDAIPAAARHYAAEHSAQALWLAVTRFAILAHAPSQHAKRAVLACRAAHEVRDALGERWLDLLIECAVYTAASRQPWSEPPILEPPAVETDRAPGLEELRAAVAAGDRLRAERWLAASLEDAVAVLNQLVRGDGRLMLDAAIALVPLVGEQGRYALLRMVVIELLAESSDSAPRAQPSLDELVARAIEEQGSIESVREVFVSVAGKPGGAMPADAIPELTAYPLARDYAQTLIAHSIAHRLPARAAEFLAAVHHNLEHGESYAAWSFA